MRFYAFQSSTYSSKGTLIFRVTNFDRDGSFDLSDTVFFPTEKIDERFERYLLTTGEIIMVMVGGSIGKTTMVDEQILPALLNQNMWRIRSFGSQMSNRFEYLQIKAINQTIENLTASTHGHFAMADFELKPIAIPPIAEQYRIVAKVDELMALCDRLEAGQREQESRRDRLTAASHHHFNNGDDSEALRSHAHFFIGHIPRLTSHPDQIKQLRQTILNLAVRGQLVPQNPNDEPAPSLLRRIQAEKARLAKAGVIRMGKSLPPVNEADLFQLPDLWAWTRWDMIALKIGDIDHKMPETVADGIPFVSPRDFLPNNRIDFDGAKRISVGDFVRLSAKMRPTVGDLIYPRYGTIGENRLVSEDRDFLVSYSCAVIKVLHGFVDAQYQYLFSISPFCRQQARAAENKTTQANVGIKSIQEFAFALPPLAEQHRIVAKVDELMTLCDELEVRLSSAQTDTRRLLEAVLHQALNAGSPASRACPVL